MQVKTAHTRTPSCTHLNIKPHIPGQLAAHPAAHTRTTSYTYQDTQLHTPGQPAVHTWTTSCTHQDNQLCTPGQPAAHTRTASCTQLDSQPTQTSNELTSPIQIRSRHSQQTTAATNSDRKHHQPRADDRHPAKRKH